MNIHKLLTLLTTTIAMWNAPPPITYRSPRYIRKLFREFHPHVPNPSVEHCVPQSMFKPQKILGRDMHNLLSMPAGLNSHRSNFKLVQAMESMDTSKITKIKEWDAWKCPQQRIFMPPDAYKGRYARAIGYFYLVYPVYQERILTQVLDSQCIIEWNLRYPPSDEERRLHDVVTTLQENENPLMVPSSTYDALHEIFRRCR